MLWREGKTDLVGFVILIAGFFIYLVNDRMELFALVSKQTRLSENIAPLQEEVRCLIELERNKSAGAVVVLPGYVALKQLSREILKAAAVVNVGCAGGDAVQSSEYRAWLEAIKLCFTEHKVSFTEISFVPDPASERVAFITEMARITKRRGEFNGFVISTLSADLLSTIPILNFTILYDDAGGSQVFLGWSAGTDYGISHKAYIFSNPSITEYFSAHAIALKKAATRIDAH
jgi:hypothetical protein